MVVVTQGGKLVANFENNVWYVDGKYINLVASGIEYTAGVYNTKEEAQEKFELILECYRADIQTHHMS